MAKCASCDNYDCDCYGDDEDDDVTFDDDSGGEDEEDEEDGYESNGGNANYESGVTGKCKAELDKKWEDLYERLLEFRMEHGHCNVSVGFKNDPKLARWVALNRTLGRENRMDLERKEKLELIGFSWGFFRDKSLWQKQYENLCAYKKKHGDCKVPRIYEPDRSLF